MKRPALLYTLALCAASGALAQGPDPDAAAARLVADSVAEIEGEFDCDIATHGAPRFDPSSNTWLVAFSATGEECEAASSELVTRGQRQGATFYRRPNAGEIRGLTQRMAVEVSRAFGCQVSVRGKPSFDEQSAYWSVSYTAFGSDCGEAERELGRRGREFQIVFTPIRGSPGVLR